mmetsp:Transcript_30563/g.71793  ORF Transcript_30563/g.71793 Transcript_30563/m.71793 type:complete len:91 (-) Transcript_30563:37-309(-)
MKPSSFVGTLPCTWEVRENVGAGAALADTASALFDAKLEAHRNVDVVVRRRFAGRDAAPDRPARRFLTGPSMSGGLERSGNGSAKGNMTR